VTRLPSAKESRGQKQHGPEQGKYCLEGYPDEAKWEGHQPDQWPQQQRQQGKWPAKNKQNQPAN
jgi:hypothetical protein